MSLQQLTEAQANPEIPVNRNFQSLEHQAVYGQRQAAHSGLTYGYHGGRWGGFLIADGTVTLTNAADNYIVVLKTTGAVSVSTATTNWNNTTSYARVYKLTTAGSVVTVTEDHRAGPNGVHGGAVGGTESFIVAASDETTPITVGTNKVRFRMPYALTLTGVRASVNTAPTGATIIIDINEGGTSVLSTRLSIDTTKFTSTTAASAAVISDAALADDAEIGIDFDQVGSTIAGTGVKVYLIGTKA
jgi:hypothetical protein